MYASGTCLRVQYHPDCSDLTGWGTLDREMLYAGGERVRHPWILVTLVDAYFAFLSFFVWIVWRELRWGVTEIGFILLMSLVVSSSQGTCRFGSIAPAGETSTAFGRLFHRQTKSASDEERGVQRPQVGRGSLATPSPAGR